MTATNGARALIQPFTSAPIRIRAARSEDLSRIVAVLLDSFYPQAKATQWFYWLMRIGIKEDLKVRLKTASDQYACLVAAAIEPASEKPLMTVEQPGLLEAYLPLDRLSSSSSSNAPSGNKLSGTVIGTIEISQRPCETWRFFPPRRAYLSNLAIDYQYRRQGAAKQLLHTCESVARGWGFHCTYLHVMADNQAAQSLYEQAGYQLCEVSNPILSSLGIRTERLLMFKQLHSENRL